MKNNILVRLYNLDRVRAQVFVAPGTTVRQCVPLLDGGREEFQTPTLCIYDGKPLLRENNGWDAPVEGHSIRFQELPLGGGEGSNAAQLISIVTTICAIACLWIPVVGPYVAMGVQLVGSIVAGIVAANAAGKQPAANAEQASPTYSLNSSGNTARLFQPEPEGFGRMKIVPDYVAQPWACYRANDQFVNYVFGIGRGEYDVESMFFGDSLFWDKVNGLSELAEQTNGWDHEAGLSIAPDFTSGAYTESVPACSAGETCRKARLVVRCARGHGWYAYNTDGGWYYQPLPLVLSVQYSPTTGADAGTWTTVSKTLDFGDTPVISATGGDDMAASALSQGAERAVEISFPKDARYNVRIADLTGDIVPPSGEDLPDGYAAALSYQSSVWLELDSSSPAADVHVYAPGENVNLFATNVYTSSEVSGLTVYAPNAADYEYKGDGWLGPYAANPPGTVASALQIDIVYPSGLIKYDEEGSRLRWTVDLQVQARAIDDSGTATGDWVTIGTWTDGGRTTTARRKTRSILLRDFGLADGRYEVRLRRTSNTDRDNQAEPSMDDCQWTGLRARLPGQLKFPQAVVAVRVRATNALSQASSQQFSVVATRKLPIWDVNTKTWSEPVATRRWAAAVCAICQESWGGCLPDSQIDLDTLWRIDGELCNKATPWYFDCYIDGAYSLWQLIQEACRAVLVVPRMQGTVLSFVQDEPGRAVEYELNARNIVRGSLQVTYNTWTEDTPDDVILNYLDEDARYQQRDVQARLSDSESNEPATLDWIGITNREHAFRLATRYAAMNRWRRVSVTCEVEALGRLLQTGDVVSLNHPRFRATRAGVVRAWKEENLQLIIDRDFDNSWEDDLCVAQYISLTRPDGTAWGPVQITGIRPVVYPDGTSSREAVTLDSTDYASWLSGGGDAPWAWLSAGDAGQPTAYALHQTQAFTRRMIVQKVEPRDHWHFGLTLVNDAPEVAQYDSAAVPTWNARTQINAGLSAPPEDMLRVTITVPGRAAFAWNTGAARGKATGYEVHYSADGVTWTHCGVTPAANEARLTRSLSGFTALRKVRIRAVNAAAQSAWSVWTALDAPENFTVAITEDGATFSWAPVTGAKNYRVYYSLDGEHWIDGGMTYGEQGTSLTISGIAPVGARVQAYNPQTESQWAYWAASES